MDTKVVKDERSLKIKQVGWLLPICLIIAGLFFTLGASHYTSQTEYCMSCHEMNTAVSSWQQSTHGMNNLGITADCQSCHIPGNTLQMLVTKAGKLSELYVHLVEKPTPFEFKRMSPELARRARAKILNENCEECHVLDNLVPQNQTQQIAHSTAANQTSCVSCHQTVGHGKNTEREGELK
ncbi:MAG: hypothetical protein VR72_19665 [Clostridiaceae bacterium BRH_c20a]|nr:MAG: hypothetical protein VR72_19665 [Clostridiaceae bacterium BRH_c20a]